MGADIRGEGKPDEFFFGLQVNQPYNWEGGKGGGGGVRNGSLWYTENESEKLIHLFPVFFLGGGGWGIKETVSIWILELEVVKSQITI